MQTTARRGAGRYSCWSLCLKYGPICYRTIPRGHVRQYRARERFRRQCFRRPQRVLSRCPHKSATYSRATDTASMASLHKLIVQHRLRPLSKRASTSTHKTLLLGFVLFFSVRAFPSLTQSVIVTVDCSINSFVGRSFHNSEGDRVWCLPDYYGRHRLLVAVRIGVSRLAPPVT